MHLELQKRLILNNDIYICWLINCTHVSVAATDGLSVSSLTVQISLTVRS